MSSRFILWSVLIGIVIVGRGAEGQAAVAMTLDISFFEKLTNVATDYINTQLQNLPIPGLSKDVGAAVHVHYNTFTFEQFEIGSIEITPIYPNQLQFSLNDIAITANPGCGVSWDPHVCLPLVGCFCFPFCTSCDGNCYAQATGMSMALTLSLGQDPTGQVIVYDPVVTTALQSLDFSFNPSGFFCQIVDDIVSIFFNINQAIDTAVTNAFQDLQSLGGDIAFPINSYLSKLPGICGIKMHQTIPAVSLYVPLSTGGCSITTAPDMALFNMTQGDFSVILQLMDPPAGSGYWFGCYDMPVCCDPAAGSGFQCLQLPSVLFNGDVVELSNCNTCLALSLQGGLYLGISSTMTLVPP